MRPAPFHITLLALLAGPFLSLAPADAGDRLLWLEAEDAARHNFPPPEENPFRPVEFWETDVPSNGEWLGKLWKKGDSAPFLEFDIEVPEAGNHSLYARKFYRFGNFRWQVDGGPWETVPDALHDLLDNVSMREAGERITLNWFYMGSRLLESGRHTLRIESVPKASENPENARKGEPLAYDAFVLTPDAFFPSGNLKPGEKYPGRDGREFAFQPLPEDFLSPALDLRELNEPFAGARGGIEVRDGNLVYRDNGEAVRMAGINYPSARFVSPGAMEHLARLLARRGLNFVRLDIGALVTIRRDENGVVASSLEPVSKEQFVRFIDAMKRAGIYTALTWNAMNSEGAGALVPAGNAVSDPAAVIVFDPEVRQAWRAAWEAVLDLRLPDGSQLGKDPALFLVTLAQQSSLLDEGGIPWSQLTPGARAAMEASWQKWNKERPGESFVDDGHSASNQSPPNLRALVEGRSSADQEALRFLVEVQRGFYQETIQKLRDSGYQGLVSCSNLSNQRPELLGLAEMQSRLAGDVLERHGNLRGDFYPKYDVWSFTEGAVYSDRSPVALDTPRGQEGVPFELPFRAPAYPGHPSLFTEAGITLPNRFSGEFPLLAFTLSSLQNVQAIGFTGIPQENWQTSHTAARNQIFTPALLGQIPALAFAYRKGLLPGPVTAGRYEVQPERVYSLQPAGFFEAPNTQVDSGFRVPESSKDPTAPDPALWLTGAIEVKTDAKADSFEALAPGKILADGLIEAADGQVRWEPRRRLFLVDAPSFQAAAGALRDAGTIRLGHLEIRSPMETGAICVVALDGQPLDFSRKMLVQVFGAEANTGFHSLPSGDFSVIRSSGRPPLLLKEIAGEILFLRPDADELVVTALDANGAALLPAGIGGTLRLLPSILYYLVEK